MQADDAYNAYVEENELQNDEYNFEQRGHYLFLLDRSGSMGGSRIEKAKEALILFIKSLPIDSYFNVISFGSNFTFLRSKSEKFSKESVDSAIN